MANNGQRIGLPEELRNGCVLYLPGDVSGTTAYDASGNGNNCTLVNSPTPIRRQGYKGFSYNGSSYTTRGDACGVNNHYTLSCNVKLNSELPSNDWTFMQLENTIGGNVFGTGIQYVMTGGIRYLRCFRVTHGAVYAYVDYPITLGTERNYRISTTYDGAVAKMFVDGYKISEVASTGFGNNTAVGTHISIARYFNGGGTYSRPDAQILNPTIHNRALSADEIRLDYETFFTP